MDLDTTHTLAIVDDEEDLRETYRTALERSFHVVDYECADDCIKAMDSESPPDVFLSDLRMPGRNGIEFLKWLRENEIERPFVILSGFAEKDDAIEAMRLGAFGLIEKPCNLVELFLTLSRASAYRLLQQINEELLGRHQEMIQSLDKYMPTFSEEARKTFEASKAKNEKVIAMLDRYQGLYRALDEQDSK